jgi:hypothetical protein
LKRSFILSSLVAPLIVFTVAWSVYISRSFRSLSKYVNLSAVYKVQLGTETEDVSRLRAGHPVTWSQRSIYVLHATVIPTNSFPAISIDVDTLKMMTYYTLLQKMITQIMYILFRAGVEVR